MPSLWVMARLQLGLGVISLAAGLFLGVLAAGGAFLALQAHGVPFAISALIGGFTFGTAGALFLFGAAVTAYLASRDDRERDGRWQGTEPPKPEGAPHGAPPTPPPFRAPSTLLGKDRKAFEDDYRSD
jgi:hypothetical protein